jgi:hypothetical protein
MPIPPLNLAERRFVAANNLTAIAISTSGRIFCISDPQGCTACFWVPSHVANELAAAIWRGDDPERAARKLGTGLILHPVLHGLAKRKFQGAGIARHDPR